MTSNRIQAYTTNKLFEAEMIKQYLFDNEIQSFILNKMDSSYLFGEIEILVARDDLIRSKKLIADFLKK
ncbi:MAG: DUF2007 domain-containing protein [Bacteroidales bacterium]|nr:DUF2007 domain-containing protein [Bacteroidales bacterium]